MARTQLAGQAILDGSLQRKDMDTTTSGQAVITKVVAGENIELTSTGADAGTGDVTVKVAAAVGIHINSAHAPSDAQKNSNILKSEIEAKLTGQISSHSHPGGGSTTLESIIDIEYADLLTAIDNVELIPNQLYRLTDYQSVTEIAGTTVLNYGSVEPLILKAVSANILAAECYSEEYPTDILHYSTTSLNVNGFGIIVYREDTQDNIKCYFDFRSAMVRLWEDDTNSGIFICSEPQHVGDAYEDQPVFRPFQRTDENYANHHQHVTISTISTPGRVPHIHFAFSARKVIINSAPDPCIFYDLVNDSTIASCSSVWCYKAVDRLSLGGGQVVFKGIVNSVSVPFAVTTFEGDIEQCLVMPGYASNSIVVGNHLGEVLGYPSISSLNVIEITHAALQTNITNNTLIPNQLYKIDDFRTIHNLVGSSGDWPIADTPNEPLIVRALDVNKLDLIAQSVLYPEHIIHYTPNMPVNIIFDPTTHATYTGIHYGCILYREDTARNISGYFDWLNAKIRLWETETDNSIFMSVYERVADDAYITMSMFPIVGKDNETPTLHKNIEILSASKPGRIPPICFKENADKVRIEYAPDPCIFNESVYDTVIRSCSSVFAYGDIYRLTFNGGVGTFLGSVNNVNIGTLMTDATFTGSLTDCHIFEGFSGTVIGDRSEELIGFPITQPAPVDYTDLKKEVLAKSIAIQQGLYLI